MNDSDENTTGLKSSGPADAAAAAFASVAPRWSATKRKGAIGVADLNLNRQLDWS